MEAIKPSKWYDVSVDQEPSVIHEKRQEWFPRASNEDWGILKQLYESLSVQKRQFTILMKDAVKFFKEQDIEAVNNFCEKFNSKIISVVGSVPYVQINDPGYKVLIDETFNCLRETKYWYPLMAKLLMEGQTDVQTLKTDYLESELSKRLMEFESAKEKAKHLENPKLLPSTIRRPNIASFIVSGVASYYSVSDNEFRITLQPYLLTQSAQQWYEGFFKSHFGPFEPKPVEEKAKPLPDTKKTYRTAFNIYSYISHVGNGGSGYVHKVQDSENNFFAVKVLNPKTTTVDKAKRFKQEVNFCRKNVHPNIVKVYDDGILPDAEFTPFYVMPFYDGTLRKLMKNKIENENILKYFVLILHGIKEAHSKNIRHRDLKPENILYDAAADNLLVADFGIAHFEEDFLITSVNSENAKLHNNVYAAPEQRVEKSVDHRADIYALGLMLNEMFTGEVIQGSGYKTINEVAPEYAYLDELVELMTQQQAENRMNSIDEIIGFIISRQTVENVKAELEELDNIEINGTVIEDRILRDPIKILPTNYTDGKLIFKVVPNPNNLWLECFKKMGEDFKFDENQTIVNKYNIQFFGFGETVAITVSEEDAQQGVDVLKACIEKTRNIYEKEVREVHANKIKAEREENLRNVTEQQRKLRILKSLKF